MNAFFVHDDRGAVMTDWVALTAGIILLGIIVVYSVLGNSHANLVETFDHMNRDINGGDSQLAALQRSIDANR